MELIQRKIMDTINDKRQPIKLINKSEVTAYMPMADAIDNMALAFASLSSGDCHVPNRSVFSTPDERLTLLLKPAFIDESNNSSIKILSQKNVHSLPGIPTILGIVMLFDNHTGEIISIMDGEFITALRTGAASGLATRELARKESCNMALFGCGAQGKTQLEAVNEVRDLKRIWVFDTSREIAESFIKEISTRTDAQIEFTEHLSVLKDVDIICTATNSNSPLFFKEHVRKGTHINAIGSFKPDMKELDPELIKTSRVFFDSQESCLTESGDFIDLVKTSKPENEYCIGELGEYLLNRIKGRISPDDITIFKSVGTAIQDLTMADEIYTRSIAHNFGQEIKLYE